MDNKVRARVLIGEILDLALNRHVHLLDDAGYLHKRKHSKDYGYENGVPKPALKLKRELIEEICRRFEPAVADYLQYPRENLWPVHDDEAVKAQLRENFP